MEKALYWLACYAIGNIMAAAFVGKWKRQDLQERGSGNLGARNAGRVLGRLAFFITFFGDGLKGAVAVCIGKLLGCDEWAVAAGLLFVILGHVYPAWLRFRGGKGVAAFIGAGLVLDSLLFCWMIAGTLPVLLVKRDLAFGMLGGFTSYIAGMLVTGKPLAYSPVIAAIGIILWKHRENFAHSRKT